MYICTRISIHSHHFSQIILRFNYYSGRYNQELFWPIYRESYHHCIISLTNVNIILISNWHPVNWLGDLRQYISRSRLPPTCKVTDDQIVKMKCNHLSLLISTGDLTSRHDVIKHTCLADWYHNDGWHIIYFTYMWSRWSLTDFSVNTVRSTAT